MFLALLALALPSLVAAVAFEPKITTTDMGRPPQALHYFDDSSVIVYLDNQGTLFRSSDDGATWSQVQELGKVVDVVKHPFDQQRAVAVVAPSNSGDHQVIAYTNDRGQSWNRLTSLSGTVDVGSLHFHNAKGDYALFQVAECDNDGCKNSVWYTTDWFRSTKQVGPSVRKCMWAHGSLGTDKSIEQDTMVCIGSDKATIVVSPDFFKSRESVRVEGTEVTNAGDVELVKGFFLFTDNEEGDDGARLGVSRDLRTWQWAQFPDGTKLVAQHLTVLESSNHSLHVDIASKSSERRGTFYTSSSDGVHFSQSLADTVRSSSGLVDIEKVDAIEGILIANVNSGGRGRVQSRISYDDGRTWNPLKLRDCTEGLDTCSLHLHSLSDYTQVGRIFSSPAPGVIAGIGNVGSELGVFERADLYVSTDSGLTWSKALTGPHIYEFGDQGNILVAAKADDHTSKAFYSLDRGSSWQQFWLPLKFDAAYLVTVPDSTSAKFVLFGTNDGAMTAVHLDFGEVHSRKCAFNGDGSGDFEKWFARYDSSGSPSCLMGRKQYFWRKKVEADCLVGDLYHEQFASAEPCPCTSADYECDSGFIWNSMTRKCMYSPSMVSKLHSECSQGIKNAKVSTGYRLVPGDVCIQDKGEKLDGEQEVTCDSLDKLDGNIVNTMSTFAGQLSEYVYLKKTGDEPNDETIFMRTSREEIFITHDQGGVWEQVLEETKNIGILTNPFFSDIAVVLTSRLSVHITFDRGRTWKTLEVPMSFDRFQPISFHQTQKEWLLFNGMQCDSPFQPCVQKTYYSKNGGRDWSEIDGVQRCSWIGGFNVPSDDNLLYCISIDTPDDPTQARAKLVSSTDFFQNSQTHFESIVGFALENEFLVVAVVDEEHKELKAYVSVDGKSFAAAEFPPNFRVHHQQAYTILESRTNSVFMHVTVNGDRGSEYGTLLKSNSNGTDYVVSMNEVNRNEFGFVDFERMLGLEGVIVINTVINAAEAGRGSRKQLKTQITFNDGAEWSYLTPPDKDVDGLEYDCSGRTIVECSLNLHGYTERVDYRDTYSSGSAVGLMIGVGNVGPWLTDYKDGNTYLTRDGGVTWKEIRKGAYMWEYGDSGSIIALVNGHDSTNTLLYSLNEGETWNEYEFYDDLVKVDDIATVPSDTSRKFVLFGRLPAKEGDKSFAVEIDFSGLTDRQCSLDTGDSDTDDFELWTPAHPSQDDNCLFGHEAQYHRKKPNRNCYIGWSPDQDFGKPHIVVRNCTCTRRDFECDFNYVRATDGTCQLVPGYTPPDHQQVCAENPNVIEWWEPTGYRRIPLSTCEGGQELDKVESHPCPGHQDDYDRKHRGLHGFWLAVVILLPIGMVGVLGYMIWDHYSKNYGQIRLGEEDAEQPLPVQWAVVAVAAVYAVVSVVPGLLRSIITQARQQFGGPRYTSRASLSGVSHRYSPVDVEDSEILAGDDDDDFDDDELAQPHRNNDE